MNDTIHVGTRKGLFVFKRSEEDSWKIVGRHFLGDEVNLSLFDRRADTLYATLYHGHFGVKLHRLKGDGAGEGAWEEIACPTYPPKPEDVEDDINPMNQKATPWSLQKIWALAAGGDDQPGRLWCGTIPGGLFKSDDSGDSWELVHSLWDKPERKRWFGGGEEFAGIHSIFVDPSNSRRVTVAVSCGGVWVTEDDGETWECRSEGLRAEYMPPEQAGDPVAQDPHCLVGCASNPDGMWIQHHNGIFKSENGAQKWTEIEGVEPSVFGFAVAVHPDESDTAWFVPAIKDEKRIPVDGQLVVTRTRDGGQTFDILREGLPQKDAYDLVLRHALDVGADGALLAFGSTTGNLWVSQSQGDSWQSLAQTLPPIYSVFVN